jgi:hypothetical protein
VHRVCFNILFYFFCTIGISGKSSSYDGMYMWMRSGVRGLLEIMMICRYKVNSNGVATFMALPKKAIDLRIIVMMPSMVGAHCK